MLSRVIRASDILKTLKVNVDHTLLPDPEKLSVSYRNGPCSDHAIRDRPSVDNDSPLNDESLSQSGGDSSLRVAPAHSPAPPSLYETGKHSICSCSSENCRGHTLPLSDLIVLQRDIVDNDRSDSIHAWLEQLPLLLMAGEGFVQNQSRSGATALYSTDSGTPNPFQALPLYDNGLLALVSGTADEQGTGTVGRPWSVQNRSTMSVHSGSTGSDVSSASHASWSGRRGRRTGIDIDTYLVLEPQTYEPKQPYECTWCWKKFAKPSDWKRHEESQHAPQTEWICMPEGPTIIHDKRPWCVLCNVTYPSAAHLDACLSRSKCYKNPPETRRFDRKDHLIQHLTSCHNFTPVPEWAAELSSWRRSLYTIGEYPLWKCGYCDMRGMTWMQRYSHVARHMKTQDFDVPWRRCYCIRQGYSPRLPLVLSQIGFGDILAEKCVFKYLCGAWEKEPVVRVCLDMFPTIAKRDQHCTLKHLPSRTPANNELLLLLTQLGLRHYWCGFCKEIMELSGPLWRKFGSYDCARLSHINNTHVIPRFPNVWSLMSKSEEEKFMSLIIMDLERSFPLEALYPKRLRPAIYGCIALGALQLQIPIGR